MKHAAQLDRLRLPVRPAPPAAALLLLAACSACPGAPDDGGSDGGTQPAIGDPCETGSDCGTLGCALSLPGGYCTLECEQADDCPSGSVCLVQGGLGLCLRACTGATTCRDGYTCNHGVCDLPCAEDAECFEGEICVSGTCQEVPIGRPCAQDAECDGALACTSGQCTLACGRSSECPSGAVCTALPEGRRCVATCTAPPECEGGQICSGGACLRPCAGDADCAAGYTCDTASGACRLAAGEGSQRIDLGPVNPDRDLSFDLPAGVVSFTLQLRGQRGTEYAFTSLRRPDGTELINTQGAQNPFTEPLRVMPQTEVVTVQLPNADDPRLTPAPGTWCYRFRGGSAEAELFVDVAEGGEPVAGTVDLNIFISPNAFPGGVRAADAPTDPFVQDTLAYWRHFYRDQAGIDWGEVRYFDLGPEWDSIAVNLQGDGEQNALWSLGRDDGLNIFFVQNIDGPFGAVAGVSGGIPGPPRTGGTSHSGVVIEVQQDATLTGVDFCHEAGHFQGLFHVSEMFGQGHDLLADTPECDPPFGDCTEAQRHLMFPSLSYEMTVLSPSSARVVRANAGVR